MPGVIAIVCPAPDKDAIVAFPIAKFTVPGVIVIGEEVIGTTSGGGNAAVGVVILPEYLAVPTVNRSSSKYAGTVWMPNAKP